MKISKKDTDIFVYDNFLSNEECDTLAALIDTKLSRSQVTNPNSKDRTVSNFRTSLTHVFEKSHFIEALDKKICDATGIDKSKGEHIQGQKYNRNSYFKEHTDFFEPNSKEYELECSTGGNRTITFMIYLNDDFKGGNTYFNKLEFSVVPKKGRAVVWNSLHKDGSVNYNTSHEGSRIVSGKKYIITKWFRMKDYKK